MHLIKNCISVFCIKIEVTGRLPIRIWLTITSGLFDAFAEKVAIKNQHGRFSTRKRHFVAEKCEKFGIDLKFSYLCSVERKM